MSKESGINPTEDEIWGPGGLAEQIREERNGDPRRLKNEGPTSNGQSGIRECKVPAKFRRLTDGIR
jgi:hypothetical protein